MKIVLKYINELKVCPEECSTFEKIKEHIHSVFKGVKNPELSYVDQDGEPVIICSEEDLCAMKEMYPDKHIMKIDIVGLEMEGGDEEKEETEEEKQEREKREEEQREYLKKKEEELEKEAEQFIKETEKKIKQKKKRKDEDKFTHKFNKLKNAFQKEIDAMINQKLQAQIPILMQIIEDKVNNNGKEGNQPVVNKLEGQAHVDVVCSACQADPIRGIRYKCLDCICFNLCSVCEGKIQHDHDLLKMKKPSDKKIEDIDKQHREKKLMKCAKKFVKVCNRSSSKDSSHSKDKCRRWRRRRHHPWRMQSNIMEHVNENDKQKDMTMSRPFHPPHHGPPFPMPPYGYMWNHPHGPLPPYRAPSEIKTSAGKEEIPQKMNKTISQMEREQIISKVMRKIERNFNTEVADKFAPFVEKNFNMGVEALMKVVKAQNPDKSQMEKISIKVRKLSLYLDQPESEFLDLVKQNPEKNIKQLLRMMNLEVEEQKLNKMRKKFKNESKVSESYIQIQSSIIKEPKEQMKIEEEPEKKEEEKGFKDEEFPEEKQKEILEKAEEQLDKNLEMYRKNSKDIREKGRILMDMKEIFGDDRSGQIFRFIEKHFEEGQEKIIQLWLDAECEKKYS